MTVAKHTTYAGGAGGVPTSAYTSELNSLANGALSSASPMIDNSVNKHLFMDLWLTLAAQAANRSTGAFVEVLMTMSLDNGTTYGSNVRGVALWVAQFNLDGGALAAREAHFAGVQIPPGKFKLSLYNGTGQAFAASGNTLKYDLRSIDNV